MNVTGVGVERCGSLRELERNATFCYDTLTGVHSFENLNIHTVGGTRLNLAFFERHGSVLHKHKVVAHLLHKSCAGQHHI